MQILDCCITWFLAATNVEGILYFVLQLGIYSLCSIQQGKGSWWSLGGLGFLTLEQWIEYLCWFEHTLCLLQTCQTPIRPITPSNLLDSICWSVSEPTSTASIYTDSFSVEDPCEHNSSIFFDPKVDGKNSESSFLNSTRPLTERLLTLSVA